MLKKLLPGLFIGIFLTISLISIATMMYYSSLPKWKQTWFKDTLLRIPLSNDTSPKEASLIFASPDSWDKLQSSSSPSNYHKNRTIKYDSTTNKSHIYTEKLKTLASTKTAAKKRSSEIQKTLTKLQKLPSSKKKSYAKNLIQNHINYFPTSPPDYTFLSHNKETLWIKGRFGAKFRTLTLSPNKAVGIFIGLHGRGASPEGVIGKINDYSNSFGKTWHEQGYLVFAPDVQPNSKSITHYPRLGLSATGADIALIMDLIKYINDHHPNLPIIIGGISYGSKLAELVGILSDNIKGVISIGGASRYEYVYSNHSLPAMNNFDHYLNSSLDLGGVYDLILPKLLVISVGNYDAGNWGRDGENKAHLLHEFSKRNVTRKNNFRINLFHGVHEADPQEEIRLYIELEKLNAS